MGRLVHVVDVGMNGYEGAHFDNNSTTGSNDIVIKLGPMCNGNAQVIASIKSSAKKGEIDGLIFYGHGSPGIQVMGAGDGSDPNSRDGLSEKDLEIRKEKLKFEQKQSMITAEALEDGGWRELKPLFSKDGHVVLKGCNTGSGEKGDDLLAKMSKVFGVPVTAGTVYQATGYTSLVGETKTARPSGSVSPDKGSKEANQKNFDSLPLWLRTGLMLNDKFRKPDDTREIKTRGNGGSLVP